jgi:hypothetical protein
LGIKKVSLASLLDKFNFPFKEEIKKGKETLTISDWRVRPLSDLQQRYAVLDVVFLIPLCLELLREISSNRQEMEEKLLDEEQIEGGPPVYNYLDVDNLPDDTDETMAAYLNQPVDLDELGDEEDDEEDWDGWGCGGGQTHMTLDGAISSVVLPTMNKSSAIVSTLVEPIKSSQDPPLTSLISAIIDILSDSQKTCSKLWKPKKESGKDHLQVFKLRKKSDLWSDMHIFIFKELFYWRERCAQLLDESPTYICPAFLLLSSALHLPSDYNELIKMWTPLPAFVRSVEEVLLEGVTSYDDATSLLYAIKCGVDLWEKERSTEK